MCARICRLASAQLVAAFMAPKYSSPSGERMGAQASSRSGSAMPRREAALARLTRKSVPIWCPSPREPQWMDTTTWPSATPNAAAASAS